MESTAKQIQIGWYHLDKDTEMTNHYECAAWYERVLIKAGDYPVYARGLNGRNMFSYHERNREYTNQLENMSISIHFNGTITSDNFQALFCGNAIAPYDHTQNTGKESNVYQTPYTHALAKNILSGNDPVELFPEWQAQEIPFEYDGKPCKTYGIFKI